MNAIQARNISKHYRTRVKQAGLKASFKGLVKPEYRMVTAVDNVSFDVGRGETLAFIGPNGAGKSTTIKIMTGILHPDGGSMRVLGFDPLKERRAFSYHIGTVFGQRSQLWFHLPAIDSFQLLGSIYDIDKAVLKARIDDLTERFELGELLTTPVRKLSLGQRIRCEIAASLLHEPEILFLDEPTIGLDVTVKQAIRDRIRDLNQRRGTTVFLTSHDSGDIEQLCQRAMVIDRGRIVLDRPVKSLQQEYMNEKRITLRLSMPFEPPQLPGLSVISQAAYETVLHVDTQVIPVAAVMNRCMENPGIEDITIADPPMERIIAKIFAAGREERHAPA